MADFNRDINALIPQGPPFIMVDTLLYADEHTIRSSFRIRTGNPLVEAGRFGAAGLMENLAQTLAAAAGYTALAGGGAVRPGYIVSVKDLQIRVLPRLGDQLLTEIAITARVADIIVISGKITRQDELIATGEMKILISV